MFTSLLTAVHFSFASLSGDASPAVFRDNPETRSVILEARAGKAYRARTAGKRGGALKRIRRGRA